MLNNLDALVMIYKTSLNNVNQNYPFIKQGVIKFFFAKDKLLGEHKMSYKSKVILKMNYKFVLLCPFKLIIFYSIFSNPWIYKCNILFKFLFQL
jgi:hypothetical protein